MKSHRKFIFILLTLSTINCFSINIIPYPQQIIENKGQFIIDNQTDIILKNGNPAVKMVVSQFIDKINTVGGCDFIIKTDKLNPSRKSIVFQLVDSFKNESYNIQISPRSILIQAAKANGFFYAIQTLYQLFPANIYANKLNKQIKLTLPCVEITDYPRFKYRGLHLDVSRHFFSVDEIKKYLDAMAVRKLNRFHWHLTDDQGWRIEIKKYPLLTQIGSRRDETLIGHYYQDFPQKYDNTPYGGFYSQDEAREIVRYAAERFITVIPEIEMPGHAMAAISAYPFLSCTQEKIKVATKWGIFEDVFCPRENTFSFLQDVLTEVISIFPSEYIHIGGDECPKTRWEKCEDCQNIIKTNNLKDEHSLQSYFVQRIEKFVNSKGRKIIGWDEILEGGLAPNATVMSWRGTQGGIEAAKAGHDVVMTPGTHCYFDHYQGNPDSQPVAIGGFTPLSKVYSFEPVPAELNANESKYIIGAQANVWTEYIASDSHLEYMAFPRVSAMAEVLWTLAANKDWDRFKQNMPKEMNRYDVQNINAAKVFYEIQSTVKALENNKLELVLFADYPLSKIYYTLDGTIPNNNSKLYKSSLIIDKSVLLNAQAYVNGKKQGPLYVKHVIQSKISGKKYKVNNLNSWYKGGSEFALTNGIIGSTTTTNDWVGLTGDNDHEVLYEFDKLKLIKEISIGILSVPSLRGLISPEITIFTSTDGNNYSQTSNLNLQNEITNEWKIIRPKIIFTPIQTKFVKVVFKNAGMFTGNNQKNAQSFLFIDELSIN